MSLLLALVGAEVAPEVVPHARQPKARRRRLRWREFENLTRLDEPEQEEAEQAGPNELANAFELQLQQESARLAGLLAAAKIEQANAKQRAAAAEIAQQIEAARVAANEAIAAAMLAERLAQEIEEIDVAYITATLLND